MSVCLQKKPASVSNTSASPDGAPFDSSGITRTPPFFLGCSPSPSGFSPFGYSSSLALALGHGIEVRVWVPWILRNSFRQCISKAGFSSPPLLKRIGIPSLLSPPRFQFCQVSCFTSGLCFFVVVVVSGRYMLLFPYDPHFYLCLAICPRLSPDLFDNTIV